MRPVFEIEKPVSLRPSKAQRKVTAATEGVTERTRAPITGPKGIVK